MAAARLWLPALWTMAAGVCFKLNSSRGGLREWQGWWATVHLGLEVSPEGLPKACFSLWPLQQLCQQPILCIKSLPLHIFRVFTSSCLNLTASQASLLKLYLCGIFCYCVTFHSAWHLWFEEKDECAMAEQKMHKLFLQRNWLFFRIVSVQLLNWQKDPALCNGWWA